MSFVTPGLALAGLLAVAVPIAIFLLWRQRRTPVRWAAMRFLIEAYRKHRRRLQVEQLLLLAIRCLILCALGAALARPLLEGAGLLDTGGNRTVYFVVDDGMAAQLETSDATQPETALAGHVERAREVIAALGAGDRVGVITAGRPARAILSPPSTDHGAVLELLESLTPRAAPTDLPGALDRLANELETLDDDLERGFVYLLSDFRSGSASPEDALPQDLMAFQDRVTFLYAPPAAAPVDNVQITAVEPARSLVLASFVDGAGQVTVRLARQGGELDRDVTRVRLEGDAFASVEPRTVQWEPGQSEASCQFLLDLSAGTGETGLTARIDDDALDADNARHVVLSLRKRVRLVLVDRRSFGFEPSIDELTSGQWILRSLSTEIEGPIETVVVEPAALDLSDLRAADVVILGRPDQLGQGGYGLLRRFVDGGGLLLVVPPGGLNVHQWTDAFQEALGVDWGIAREVQELAPPVGLALEQPTSDLLRMISSELTELCRPVFFSRLLPVSAQQTDAAVLLRLTDRTPVLVAGAPRDTPGRAPGEARQAAGLVVYLGAAPQLDWTNLPTKPLMVPLLYEVVRQGLSLIRSGRPVAVGDLEPLLVGPAATSIVDPADRRVTLDERNRPATPLDAPGLYRVIDGAGQKIGAVAVNVHPPAGRTDPQPETVVQSWLARSAPWNAFQDDVVAAELENAEGVSPMAGWLLAAVLGLAILETLLARWFSHAYRSSAAGGPARAGGRALRRTVLRATIHEHDAGGPALGSAP